MILKALFLLVACLFHFQAAASGEKVITAVQQSVVFITAEGGSESISSGSGVIVMDDEVLTNCHVIENAEKITVQFSDGQKMPANVKGRVGKLDMCALSVLTNNRPKVLISQLKNIKTGQSIYAVGSPLSLKLTISDGIVSALRDDGDAKVLQITAPISPGSSGGGVFDEKGRLLGLTTFTLTKGQNLNFAIPAEYRNSIGLSPVNSEAKKEVSFTFAGLPFGASIKEFKDVYPTSECVDHMGLVVCRGQISFYLRQMPDVFYAYFDKNKFYLVDVRFNTDDPISLFNSLNAEISKHFGAAKEKLGNTDTKEDLSLGSYLKWYAKRGQSVALQLCGYNPFICKGDSLAVKVEDLNQRPSLVNEKSF